MSVSFFLVLQIARAAWRSVVGPHRAGVNSMNGDLCVWTKPNVKSTGGNRLCQTIEFVLILYRSEDGQMSASHFNLVASPDGCIGPKHWDYRRVQQRVCCLC